jgi:hypothetical protein
MNPGGRIEVMDIVYPIQADDDTLPKDSALSKWSDLLLSIFTKNGSPLDSAVKYQEQLKEVGFVDVNIVKRKWPLNRWPKDPKHKQIGWFSHLCITSLCCSHRISRCLGTTEYLGCFGRLESGCVYAPRRSGRAWLG